MSVSSTPASTASASRRPASKKSSSLLSFLYEPDEQINYKTMSLVYAVFSLTSLVLYVMSREVKSVAGFYLIPAPAIPMLLWSLFLMTRPKGAGAGDVPQPEATVAESKKDQ